MSSQVQSSLLRSSQVQSGPVKSFQVQSTLAKYIVKAFNLNTNKLLKPLSPTGRDFRSCFSSSHPLVTQVCLPVSTTWPEDIGRAVTDDQQILLILYFQPDRQMHGKDAHTVTKVQIR